MELLYVFQDKLLVLRLQPVALHDRDISLVQFKRLLKTLWFV